MNVTLEKLNFYLGEPIIATISIVNSTANTITMPEPKKSFDIELHLLNMTTKEDMSYTMGESQTTVLDGGDEWAMSIPVVNDIKLLPGESYQFTTAVHERLYLNASVYCVYITDSFNDKESEQIEISILFNEQSLLSLSALAMENAQSYSRREWAMTHVQHSYSAFKLKLPQEGDSVNIVDEYEVFNQKRYAEFMQWWNDQKH